MGLNIPEPAVPLTWLCYTSYMRMQILMCTETFSICTRAKKLHQLLKGTELAQVPLVFPHVLTITFIGSVMYDSIKSATIFRHTLKTHNQSFIFVSITPAPEVAFQILPLHSQLFCPQVFEKPDRLQEG